LDINAAIQEAIQMAANAHGQLQLSFDQQVTPDEEKRIAANYAAFFGDDTTQDVNQQVQNAGKEDRAASVIGMPHSSLMVTRV
jgi:hypothetical protein